MNGHSGNGSVAGEVWRQYENKVLRGGQWVERDDHSRPLVAVCMPHGVMIESPTAWALFGLGVAAVIHLFIQPATASELVRSMPTWESILGGLVAFYFGARS